MATYGEIRFSVPMANAATRCTCSPTTGGSPKKTLTESQATMDPHARRVLRAIANEYLAAAEKIECVGKGFD